MRFFIDEIVHRQTSINGIPELAACRNGDSRQSDLAHVTHHNHPLAVQRTHLNQPILSHLSQLLFIRGKIRQVCNIAAQTVLVASRHNQLLPRLLFVAPFIGKDLDADQPEFIRALIQHPLCDPVVNDTVKS